MYKKKSNSNTIDLYILFELLYIVTYFTLFNIILKFDIYSIVLVSIVMDMLLLLDELLLSMTCFYQLIDIWTFCFSEFKLYIHNAVKDDYELTTVSIA
jgi:hypothetical protein